MDEDATIIARGYGFGHDLDGTEWLTELSWRSDGRSVIAMVRLQSNEEL